MIGRGKHGSTKAISALPLITLAWAFDHLEYCNYNTGYTSGCGGYDLGNKSTGACLIATATMTQNTDNPLPLPSAHQAPQDQTGTAINAPQDVTEVDSFVRGRGRRGVRTAPQGVHRTPCLSNNRASVTPRRSVSDQAPIPVITPSRIILDTDDEIPPAQPRQQLSQEQAQLGNHHGDIWKKALSLFLELGWHMIHLSSQCLPGVKDTFKWK
ncbi:hypothetical protein PCASD_08362 [Puccinia coronata f. sp. avenae]|uniref:Uncharacterized protein n=1 Tax=Puccinia coronata f. sp. avenae TaxID=200324 RepID=A0A2N5TFV8_9BASI|nr:hypothetical protein PCASD_08362 [Puccinia coronata f. sp. avenae]